MPTQDERGGHWDTLARAVKDRRRELGIPTQKVAAELSGISQNTWQRLEAGRSIGSSSLVAVARTLRWQPAHVVAIIAEGEKALINAVPPDHLEEDDRNTVAQVTPIEAENAISIDPRSVTFNTESHTIQLQAGTHDGPAQLVFVPLVIPDEIVNDLEEEDMQWLVDAITRQGRELLTVVSEARRRTRIREQQQACGEA